MRLKTITRLESTTKLTRELVEALTLALGHTRAERRDLREQLVAIAADDLWEELRNRASEKKLNRKRCGAKTRRGTLCLRPALSYGRCANHGGRSMDYGPSTLEVLPEIVAAVNGRIPIIFDSGIRRGGDIFKALALGANAIMLGRTTRWGLAAFGTAGAQRVIEMLQQELVQVAAAAGCAKLADINKNAVRTHFV